MDAVDLFIIPLFYIAIQNKWCSVKNLTKDETESFWKLQLPSTTNLQLISIATEYSGCIRCQA